MCACCAVRLMLYTIQWTYLGPPLWQFYCKTDRAISVTVWKYSVIRYFGKRNMCQLLYIMTRIEWCFGSSLMLTNGIHLHYHIPVFLVRAELWASEWSILAEVCRLLVHPICICTCDIYTCKLLIINLWNVKTLLFLFLHHNTVKCL
jgi:hypothetical protein